ncbi:MAG: UDP-N-acetylmuramoyl-tripeptide--D-alanyl-D-alanine ligase [Deltaproteobacteria bacterium]|nr:UDP-N-acetylmuramoyl-tripeptide--D-alanyl-D-alanine ligase [Candidatus Zymogenaceae bacterium]
MVDSAHIRLAADEIARMTGAERIGISKGMECVGVSTDSRSIGPGELFVALEGDRFDGHDFLKDVTKRGAGAVLIKRTRIESLPRDVCAFAVDDTLFALGELARGHRERLPARVVGITGSNGKTTTKELIYDVLSRRFRTEKSRGNFNNLIGLPMMLLSMDETCEVIVVELGMNTPGEMKRLVAIAGPDIGVITNIGPVHLEGVGSIEGVYREKREMFLGLPDDGVAVFEDDGPFSDRLRRDVNTRAVTFGFGPGADVRAQNIGERDDGAADVEFVVPEGAFRATFHIPGRHNLKNSLAALAVGSALGVDTDAMKEAVEASRPVSMRMELAETKDGVMVLNDTYNANPVSVKAALEFLALESKRRGGRLLAALGDMLELGDYAREGHETVGETAAREGYEKLFILGDHSSDVARGAVRGGIKESAIRIYGRDTQSSLIDELVQEVRPGDHVLIKGSRGMCMERVANALLDSDEAH